MCTSCHYKEAVSQKRNGPIRFIHKANPKKKKPIIILELKKSLSYKMAKHFTYSTFLDKSQGLHSPIYSEPERPVTKVTLTPHDWGWSLSRV